jgi:XapX domain-containing protein
MRPYLISLAVGLAVGVIYGLIKVRSPAPPAIALLGLLGMLAGEQAVPLVKSYLFGREPPSRSAPREPDRAVAAPEPGTGEGPHHDS